MITVALKALIFNHCDKRLGTSGHYYVSPEGENFAYKQSLAQTALLSKMLSFFSPTILIVLFLAI